MKWEIYPPKSLKFTILFQKEKMAEGKVDNRGSASQQDTVWHCLAVCGMGGFPFDLPDAPHLLLKKNDLRFGSKGSCAPRCHLPSDAPAFPVRQRKKPKHSLRLFLSLFTFLFSQRQACRAPFSARGSIHLRSHASPRYAGIQPERPLYQQVRSPFSTCHQTA